jgi:hypothetical protein
VFRLLDLLAGLAGATDLGTGGQPEHAVVRDVVVALLAHVGCTAYAHESAAI